MSNKRLKYGRCLCCQRECKLTFHHLIPKKLHRRKFFRKTYSRETLNTGIDICRLCHNGIHDLYDEMTLAKQYSHIQSLLEDERLQKHYEWVAKQRR